MGVDSGGSEPDRFVAPRQLNTNPVPRGFLWYFRISMQYICGCVSVFAFLSASSHVRIFL